MARIAVTCVSIVVLPSTQFVCGQLRDISSQVSTHPSVADTGNIGLCPGQTKRVYEILPEPEKLLSCFCRPRTGNITLREAYRNGLVDILTENMSTCIHSLHERSSKYVQTRLVRRFQDQGFSTGCQVPALQTKGPFSPRPVRLEQPGYIKIDQHGMWDLGESRLW